VGELVGDVAGVQVGDPVGESAFRSVSPSVMSWAFQSETRMTYQSARQSAFLSVPASLEHSLAPMSFEHPAAPAWLERLSVRTL
jgi:hypothetical protein